MEKDLSLASLHIGPRYYRVKGKKKIVSSRYACA